ncbi:MAG TPA: Gfo/Idh/MocA family oxidoreductase [Caulobacteraceae bacterium]|nr:Gfo/Idh/MocA family oxidoreductase [Caulobacteraceae bacterium]
MLARPSGGKSPLARPRLGFLGLGWIGLHRMQSILEEAAVEVIGMVEPSPDQAAQAALLAPDARRVGCLDELLALELDGLVIATPSAMHAEQSVRALERGVAVFCQKPLGRDAPETREVVEAARKADRLIGVDLSYRFTQAMACIHDLTTSGELGQVFAIDLQFHNAYGPDKPWFYDRGRSGGGCVIDLGVHLVDLALWLTGSPDPQVTSADLFAKGARLRPDSGDVEDYAIATVEMGACTARLACSWKLHAGQDAVIAIAVHGSAGGAEMHNVAGSFYDFTVERYRGSARETLVAPPDAWGGRAALDWARRLARGEGFDPRSEELIRTAKVLDQIYAR